MSWIQGGWRKKAVFLVLLSLVSILLIRDRRGNFDQLEQLQTRLLTCTHYSDSLVSQLEVINRYKQTVEDLIGQQKNESRRAAESFELRIRELAIKNEHCQNQLGGCQRNDQTAERLVQLQTENAEQRTTIEQLESEIQRLNAKIRGAEEPKANQSLQSAGKDVRANITSERKAALVPESPNIPPPPLPPVDAPKLGPLDEAHANEAQVYAVGPNVHFHRNRPLDEPLEFRRDDREEPPADFVPQQELVKKLEERERLRNAPKDAGVEDFQVAKPDANELDYKEMEH